MPKSPHSPAFRRGLDSIKRGEILVPALRSYLMHPIPRDINITVHAMDRREPDFMFHPSTHPLWSEMALWVYMIAPDLLVDDPLDDASMLAVTVGTIWHEIIETILLDLGLLTHREFYLRDEETKSHGSADGVTKMEEIFEFKTAKPEIVRKISSVEDYIAMYPTYYAQAQEYLRLSGMRRERVVILGLSYPYEMREFVIERDMSFGNEIIAKYRRVIQAVADGRPPMCDGCANTQKSACPARGVCQFIAGGGSLMPETKLELP